MRRPAGHYNRTITVQTNTPVPGSAGDLVPGWSELCVRRARIVTGNGREVQQEQLQPQRPIVLGLPYDSVTKTINPRMRILLDSRQLEIESAVDVDNQHEEVQITCTEVVAVNANA